MTLYCNIEDFKTNNINIQINEELKKIHSWFVTNKLCINADKSKYMIYHKSSKKVPILNIKIDGNVVSKSEDFKFLGIILNDRLTWNDHINYIEKKLLKAIYILTKLRHFFPQCILLNIYNALFLSHINYSVILWGSHPSKIEIIKRRAIRTITFSKRRSHTDYLFKQLNILKVTDIYKLTALKFYYNLKKNSLSKMLISLYIILMTNKQI